MLIYRLHPHSPLEWSDFPVRDLKALVAEHNIDLDKWEWKPAEERRLSVELLRIALRYGIATGQALVIEGIHTTDVGRADELRANQRKIDELQATIRRDQGPLMEQLMPGWKASGIELDDRVRESTERAATEAEEDLDEVLAAPVNPDLAAHWTRLGGMLPDPA